MSPLPLRNSTRSLHHRRLQQPVRFRTGIAPARSLHSLTRTLNYAPSNTKPSSPLVTGVSSHLRPCQHKYLQASRYTTQTPNPPTADQLIDELQDLYEVAKDEFEIATDSTEGSTIYAASDRESARDALNQLCTVFHLYTAKPGTTSEAELGVAGSGSIEAGAGEAADGPVVETGFDPASVGDKVRDEVRRRVGQRVRELRNAVEVLEERAKAD